MLEIKVKIFVHVEIKYLYFYFQRIKNFPNRDFFQIIIE